MRLFAALLVFAVLLVGGAAHAAGVGFLEEKVANGADKPLTVGVWYPSDAPAADVRLGTFTQHVAVNGAPTKGGHPLIVMSHGTGGWYGGHYDTAIALARAGFVVAAVTHTGDSYDDHSRAAMIWGRAAHMKRVVDYMTAEWPAHYMIDARRVGVFGFSAGAFTALVASGGKPDLAKVGPHCVAHPDYFDCGVVKAAPGVADRIAALPASVWIADPRIKAAVVAAPALGFTFGAEGLKGVTIPVQLWRAENDHVLPHPEYAESVRLALPKKPEFHVVAGADHYDFLTPCDARLAATVPEICRDPPTFDRAAFHETFNREVVAFFKRTLR